MTTFDIDITQKTKYLEILESLEEQGHSLLSTHNPQTWRLSALTFALHLHDCIILFGKLKEKWAERLPWSEAWDVDLADWKSRIWSSVNNITSFTEELQYIEWQHLCEEDYHTFIEKASECLSGKIPLNELTEFLSEKNTELKNVIIDSGKILSQLLANIETMLYNSSEELYKSFYGDMLSIYLNENPSPYQIDNNGELIAYEQWKASKSQKKMSDLLQSQVKKAYSQMIEVKFWQETWEECVNIDQKEIDKEGFARFIFQNRKRIIGNKQYQCKNCLNSCFSKLCLCEHLWEEYNMLTNTERNDILREKIMPDIKALDDIVKDEYKERYTRFWNEIFEDADILHLLKEKNPNTFKGGYNQKLICNIVGKLSIKGFYTKSRNEIDSILYPEKTVYKYLSEISVNDSNTSCAMTEKIEKIIEEILKKSFVNNS